MVDESVQNQEQIERMKKEILRKILTKEAIERLGRVRFANPNLAAQVELYFLQLYQMGQINKIIDDKELKEILLSLRQGKNWNIRRL